MPLHSFRAASILLAITFFMAIPNAPANEVSGHFTADDCTFEPQHVYAVRTPSRDGDSEETMMIFTGRPLDLGLAYLFDPRQTALEDLTLSDTPAKMGLIVTVANGIANHFFWCSKEPPRTTQISGHEGGAELALSEDTARRIAGHWKLAETTTFSGETRSWDLHFALDITDPAAAANELRKNGGKPGKAYLAFLNSIEKGNIPALRRFMNNPWYFKEDATDEEIAADLETMRESQPKTTRITGGSADDSAAILEVDATMYDGTAAKQRVLLKKLGKDWVFGGWETVE